MSVYYAVGLGRADLRNGDLRNVSARRAKERRRFSLLMPLLVSKLRSFTVGEADVIIGMFASVCFFRLSGKLSSVANSNMFSS